MQTSTLFSVLPSTTIFQPQDLVGYDLSMAPHHIAIIPDGNRRWAERQHASIKEGHTEGGDNVTEIVKACKELGVKIITIYTFSTENWSRSEEEVQALMWLLDIYLVEQRQTMLDLGIQFETIGDLSRIPSNVAKTIAETKQITQHCDQIKMILAVNYGGRDDICRAVQKIVKTNPRISPEDITEEMISKNLDTSLYEDPDLLIRTSGELRISNFLLWQISYAEIYISEVLWPDFTPFHLLKAVSDFQRRKRRLGE